MSETLDNAAIDFANEVAPANNQPRDQGGKFVQVVERPLPLFEDRQIEGDPLTGDTSDGGDDPEIVAQARTRPQTKRVVDEDGIPFDDDESGQEVEAAAEADEGDDEARYEVTVDGQKHEVSLEEALNGYVRQATFHQRSGQLNELQRELEGEHHKLAQAWQAWHKARQDYEEDLGNLVPTEPNWDKEFEVNPQGAHQQQKVFQVIYNKLAQSRQARAQREILDQQEKDRRIQKYAVDGFTRFVFESGIPDEASLQRELKSMRRTAETEGFSEYEIATTYDHRMLKVLRKASKYDRMMAARPRAVIPGKGKTLTPGAATPFGNARRSGLDDAQRRLAQTGKLTDAVEVFRRMP